MRTLQGDDEDVAGGVGYWPESSRTLDRLIKRSPLDDTQTIDDAHNTANSREPE